MKSRERLQTALNHQQPDCVPVDFGSTPVTGMHVTCVAALREHYGLERRPVKVHEPYQMLGLIEDDLLDALGCDVVGINARMTIFGFPAGDWKEFHMPWGQDVLVPGQFNTCMDANGDLLMFPQGDRDVEPSGRMPVGGYFFDSIIRQPPLDEDALDPEDNLEEFAALGEEDLAYFAAQVESVSRTGRGVIATIGGTAFGDIALVPAPFLKAPRGIRDVTEWYVSTVARQDYLHEVFSAQCEMALENLGRAAPVLGDAVDALFICGTDFGTQTSSFCAPATFDELYAPYYRQVNNWIHAHTPWKTFKHSCGAVEPFMSHFVEAGFDIINPVQISAMGMEPAHLKRQYGDRLVFWGGGVNTQKTLPFGTPDEVRTEVLQTCTTFARNGGFVFNAIHNVQANTPVKNIVAMIDAVNEFNGTR